MSDDRDRVRASVLAAHDCLMADATRWPQTLGTREQRSASLLAWVGGYIRSAVREQRLSVSGVLVGLSEGLDEASRREDRTDATPSPAAAPAAGSFVGYEPPGRTLAGLLRVDPTPRLEVLAACERILSGVDDAVRPAHLARAMLTGALAPIEMGDWDETVVDRVASGDPATVATIASWLHRAAAAGAAAVRAEAITPDTTGGVA